MNSSFEIVNSKNNTKMHKENEENKLESCKANEIEIILENLDSFLYECIKLSKLSKKDHKYYFAN